MYIEAIASDAPDAKKEEVQHITVRQDALEDEKKRLRNLARELTRKAQSQFMATKNRKQKADTELETLTQAIPAAE